MDTTANSAVLTLTPSAAEEVSSLLQKPENEGKTLRIFVEQGGCSGMQYSMVFDEKRAEDSEASMHGVSVLVDPFSAQYLRGTVVDFSSALTGGGFKISNPNARQSCGCGKSFTA
ncbi:MAG TPA: iron-sulfur cluster assembly accessory protein [Verrucomicrobiae bacterium]|nr:iron-sulfur cluster assembly accessory protein [Verrucomicrobiae bacterium]